MTQMQTQIAARTKLPGFNLFPRSATTAPASRPGRAVQDADIVHLLEAAGPLALTDIAGGLDIAVADARIAVGRMLRRGCLAIDEWDRHRLYGDCAA